MSVWRDYGRIPGTFWTQGPGKALRGDPSAQLLAAYLMTNVHSTMTCLYYISMPTISHETGMSIDGVSMGLGRLSDADVAFFDPHFDYVWVREGAFTQIGDTVSPKDKKIPRIVELIQPFYNHPFYTAFVRLYNVPFNLKLPLLELSPIDAPPDDPYLPLRCKSKSKSKDQSKDQSKSEPSPAGGFSDARAHTREAINHDQVDFPVDLLGPEARAIFDILSQPPLHVIPDRSRRAEALASWIVTGARTTDDVSKALRELAADQTSRISRGKGYTTDDLNDKCDIFIKRSEGFRRAQAKGNGHRTTRSASVQPSGSSGYFKDLADVGPGPVAMDEGGPLFTEVEGVKP